MVSEAGEADEPLPAGSADVRPLARVRLPVPLQLGGADEAVPAQVARVRLLARVRAHVAQLGVAVLERLAAYLAGEGPFVGVDGQVSLEGGRVGDSFPAGGAQVGLLARVRSLVEQQLVASSEGFAAQLAEVRPLARVDGPVPQETQPAGQAGAANPAVVPVTPPLVVRTALRFRVQRRDHSFPLLRVPFLVVVLQPLFLQDDKSLKLFLLDVWRLEEDLLTPFCLELLLLLLLLQGVWERQRRDLLLDRNGHTSEETMEPQNHIISP